MSLDTFDAVEFDLSQYDAHFTNIASAMIFVENRHFENLLR